MRLDQEFSQWAREETPGLLRRARLLCLDEQHAEDLVQDTLVKLYLQWSRIHADGSPLGYAHRTMFHHFVSSRRRRSARERPMLAPHDGPASGTLSDTVPLRLDLQAALSTLDRVERAVVVARYVDDRSVAEVAHLLGRKESWVKTVTHRAVLKLRHSTALVELPS